MSRSRTPVALALALAALGAACGLAGSAAAAAPASSPSPASPVATVTSDANGRFSLRLPSVATTTHWTLVAGSALGVPDMLTAQVQLTEKMSLPTVITGFSASLDQYGQVTYSGCLGLRRGIPAPVAPKLSAPMIQYEAQPSGPWQTLGTAALAEVACGNRGEKFSGTLQAKLNLAYYRAHFAGGSTGTQAPATRYLAAASQPVLAWKLADRITSFSPSPTTVAKNRKLAVKGVLQFYHSGWQALAGQPVLIIFQFTGSSTWYYITQVKTVASGRFSATFTDPGPATWAAEYLGDSSHLATVSPMVYVTVR